MGSEITTLLDIFRDFEARGDKTALINRTGIRRHIFSYAELHRLSLNMAGWLESKGVRAGDRVVLWAPNSPWWVIAFWGTLLRGAIAVPVDFMSGLERAETIARLTEGALIIQSRLKAERLPDHKAVFLEDLPFLTKDAPPASIPLSIGPDTTAELVYTSGTTGNPKGVILTHGNLVSNLLQVNQHIPVVSRDFTFLSLLPLSHMFEQMAGLLTPLYKGSSIAYLPVLKPSAIMEALADEDIYAIIAVPRLLQLLKNSIERELEAKHLKGVFRFLMERGRALSLKNRKRLFYPIQKKFGRHFTLFVSGGAALDPVVATFWEALGFVVLEGYGLTECSPVLAANNMEERVIGSVGRVLPQIDLKLSGNEVLVKGPNVFPGYYRNEEATRQAFTPDGWFKTGDMGELDERGFLKIKGRSKEMIVTGAGVNVYPDEIEAILNGAVGVREATVIGLDRGAGEEVHAVLILDERHRDPQEIVQEASRQLDSLHQITGFSVWPDVEFPKTTTMKVQKFKVKERLAQSGGGRLGGAASDRLTNLISRVTGVPVGEIRENTRLVGDLGLTSIARLELVNLLELEFRLDLEDTAIDAGTSVAMLREVIMRREKGTNRHRLRFWTNGRFFRLARKMADHLFHYPLILAFVTLEKEGLHNLPPAGSPVLFIANHLSYLDQPVVMMSLPSSWRYRTATAAWEEFFFPADKPFWITLWKRFCYEYATMLLNVFPLPQSRGFRPALKHMGKLADSGINILIFPEGERSWDGTLLPFRLGLGIMARELDMPVVPVKIRGLEKVLPRGAGWPSRATVRVTFGEALRFTDETPGEIVERARAAVERL